MSPAQVQHDTPTAMPGDDDQMLDAPGLDRGRRTGFPASEEGTVPPEAPGPFAFVETAGEAWERMSQLHRNGKEQG